jgi:spoIIIJ-associated protein
MESPSAHPRAGSLESHLAALESLLHQMIRNARFDLNLEIRKVDPEPGELEAPEFVVEFSGRDADLLLEKNGTLLDAIEYVALKAVRLEEDLFGKITFDCHDWRSLRTEELKLTARIAADRVLETGDPFPLNPMSARERRIVHLALRDQPGVRTESRGAGPERQVVILPASPGQQTSPR